MSVIQTPFPLLAQANEMTRINNEVAVQNHNVALSDFDYNFYRVFSKGQSKYKCLPMTRNPAQCETVEML